MRFRAFLAGLAFVAAVQAGSDPPPAEALPTCPQVAARNDVTTPADVAGINVGTNHKLDSGEIDALASLGVGWARTTLRWSDIQAIDSRSYDWRISDANIRAMKAHGINVLAVLTGTPRWAFATVAGNCKRTGRPALKDGATGGTEAGCIDYQICLVTPSCTGGPQIPADKYWRTFLTAAVNRYNGSTPDPVFPDQQLPRVDAWEIWNEPNAGKDKFNGSLLQYHDLVLAPAVDQVRTKSANPAAFLVGPALATNQYANADPGITRDLVNSALRDAILGSATQPVAIDAVSVHSYKTASTTISTGLAFRGAMATLFNSSSYPLWLTEYGKDSADGCAGADATCAEAEQYCLYREFQYRNRMLSAPVVYDRAFWYALTDSMTPQRTVSQGFGVLAECSICAEPCNYGYYSKMIYGEMQRVLGRQPVPTHSVFGNPP